MLHSLAIVSTTGDIILERHYRQNLRAVLDSFIQIKDSAKLLSAHQDYIILKIDINDISFIGILQQECNVAPIAELIHYFVDIIRQCLKRIDADTICSNFSAILFGLDEFVEHGAAFNDQEFVLQAMIKPAGYMQRFTEALRGRDWSLIEQAVTNEQLQEARWRQRGLRYTLNEVLIDVIEYANVTMDKHWNYVRWDTVGHVHVKASLTGMPDLTMYVHQPSPFLHYTLHPCAFPRRKKFIEDSALSFIPPDGSFIALKYWLNDPQPQLPFRVIPNIAFDQEFMKYDIRVQNKMIGSERFEVGEFVIKFPIPHGCGKPNVAASIGTFITENAMGVWTIGKLLVEKEYTLTGKVAVSKNVQALQEMQHVLEVQFEVIGYSASGTKVERLVTWNEDYTPYKGARCVYRSGKVEVRMNQLQSFQFRGEVKVGGVAGGNVWSLIKGDEVILDLRQFKVISFVS